MFKKFISLSVPFLLIGCSINTAENSKKIEYQKTASVLCTGNYQLLSNGKVTNTFLSAFDNHFSEGGTFQELPELAQNNFNNHMHCLDVALFFAENYDISINELSDNDLYIFKNQFSENFIEIEKSMNEEKILNSI